MRNNLGRDMEAQSRSLVGSQVTEPFNAGLVAQGLKSPWVHAMIIIMVRKSCEL